MPKSSLPDVMALGQLIVAGEMASPLPLEHTGVTVQVTGLLVSVAVTQRFGNPLHAPVEMDYLFPLSPRSCDHGF
jgi:hypothetical protein